MRVYYSLAWDLMIHLQVELDSEWPISAKERFEREEERKREREREESKCATQTQSGYSDVTLG